MNILQIKLKLIHFFSNHFGQIKQLLGISGLFFFSFLNYAGASPFSNKELEQLEKEFIQQINQSPRVERNALANQYLNHIGKKLAAAAHMPTPFFFIIKSPEINAFAGPGGYIGINTQLILATTNESELAGVMAHELAHVRLAHLYQRIEHQKEMRIPLLATFLASAALGIINPTLGSGAMMATLTGFAQENINYTRSHEKEADRIGIAMLRKAGFDPRAMVSFFKKMQQSSRYYYTANIPAILRTHPLDEERIAEAENRSHLVKKEYPSSIDYAWFKEVIRNAVAPNPKLLIDYYQQQCSKENLALTCYFGQSLLDITLNQFSQATSLLEKCLQTYPDNLFLQIAMAQTEAGNHNYAAAIKRITEIQANFPQNYAALLTAAQIYLAAGEQAKATQTLLKGTRLFKKDLTICEELAHSQAVGHQKAYAYFTESQCKILQGRLKEALRDLKSAQALAAKDQYLQARIAAQIDEIKYRLD